MKKFKYFIPSFLLMFIIFSFSGQTGEESGSLSLNIVHILQSLFPFLTNTDLLHILIRKAAHMSEYAILTSTYVYGFNKNQFNFNKVCCFSLFCTFLYACSDELHQLLVSGRAGQLTDVLIDTSGGLIFLLFYYIYVKMKHK